MNSFQAVPHKYLAQSRPSCELAPWSINRTVNKLMNVENKKYQDHPTPFQELSDTEPKCFEKFCDLLSITHAFGREEIPSLLKTIQKSGQNIKKYQGLRLLADIVRDPERSEEAIADGVIATLTETLDSPVEHVVRESLIILEILAEQPFSKMAIVKNEALMTKFKSCFKHGLRVVCTACRAMLAMTSNYIAVEELLKAGCVQLVMGKLKQITAEYDTSVQYDDTVVALLKALANLIEHSRDAKLDAIIQGIFDVRYLADHPVPGVRATFADILSLLAHTDIGVKGIAAHQMKDTLLRNFRLSVKEEENMKEMNAHISNLMFTSIHSAERKSYATYAFVDELFSILTLKGSPKLVILQLLTNLSEVPETRGEISKRLKSCRREVMQGGDDIKASLVNLLQILEKDT